MENFKCRAIKPAISQWYEIEAESAGEAIQEIHSKYFHSLPQIKYRHDYDADKVEFIYFTLFEIEGYEDLVSRIYSRGIFRLGRPSGMTIKDVAEQLGWAHDPNDLLVWWDSEEDDWRNGRGEVVEQ